MNNYKRHLIYWILPSLVVLICMLIYFFDILGFSYLIAPEYNREFGIIENLQLALIIIIIRISIRKVKEAENRNVKMVFTILTLGSFFILLEEIDYGLHYYDFLIGKSKEQLQIEAWNNDNIRNLHNQGHLTGYIKLLAYTLIVLMAISPILLKKLKIINPYLNYLAPQFYIIYTIGAMITLNEFALHIDKFYKLEGINALNSNVSEFEELFIYYIVLLFIAEKNASIPFLENQIKKEKTATNNA